MYIYEILEQILKERAISIAEAAKKSNLSDSTVRGIIKRKQKHIALDVAVKLSDGLGVSLERLNGMPEKVCTPTKLVNSKNAPLYSSEAMQLAEDYDGLDDHGQRVVRLLADEEIARRKEEISATQSPPNTVDGEFPYVASSPKTKRSKARKAEDVQLTDGQADAVLDIVQSFDDPDPMS